MKYKVTFDFEDDTKKEPKETMLQLDEWAKKVVDKFDGSISLITLEDWHVMAEISKYN